MKVKVDFTVEVSESDYAAEYGMESAVRKELERMVRDHIRQNAMSGVYDWMKRVNIGGVVL